MNEKSWNKIFSRVGWGMTAFFCSVIFCNDSNQRGFDSRRDLFYQR